MFNVYPLDYGDQELQVLLQHFSPTLVKAGVRPAEAEMEWTMLKKEILRCH
ncbi:hypothetical protein DPMN_155885 [Dreissena polymorpha]|uniref:Uncharacterized protein n=1 Tax=Dreissena polymorpha TaxID=45954 RepID=A0A9D4FPN7_DREPO|nr:hypothetical protein DPMN_155885 [Dreissena polymorpha]